MIVPSAETAGQDNRAPDGQLTPVERARQLVSRYPEMTWMVNSKTHATPESSIAVGKATVGASLFPTAPRATLSEFDRAFVGIQAMDQVRAGDRQSLTDCQPEAVRLSQHSFDRLRAHTDTVLATTTAVQAMETFIAINDLGKIGSFADKVRQMPGAPDTVDHDVVMRYGLQQDPSLSPSFQALQQPYQEYVLEGMGTNFNLGQMMQAESVPASLSGLPTATKEARDFYLLHTLYDLAGAAGQVVQNGSATLTEPTAKNFQYAVDALEGIGEGKTVETAYNQYLGKKADEFGIAMSTPSDVAVTRLATMMRMSTSEQAERLKNVYDGLPENTRAILDKELSKAGTNDGIATLAYYSPALLANLQKNAGDDPEVWQTNVAIGMTTLARVYQAGRTRGVVRKSTTNSVQTILISDLAKAATTNPASLAESNIVLSGKGLDVEATLEPVPEIHLADFPRLTDLRDVPGQRIAVVGMGGGSDGIQAAIFSQLLTDAGKTCPAVMSIRTAKPQSQNADGSTATARSVRNHGGELTDGVYKMTPDTMGTGRFLEHLPAGEVPMYLVSDDETNPVTDKIRHVLHAVGGVDTVIGLDTGGDVLYPANGQDTASATPDQDVRSLKAIRALGGDVTKLCVVVATGIDSPDNAGDILHANQAVYFEPNQIQTAKILGTYRRWRMDGSDDRYYGKTPLAWQAALASKEPRGVVTLNLPKTAVVSDTNPWNPYVVQQPAMRGAFMMDIDQLQQ